MFTIMILVLSFTPIALAINALLIQHKELKRLEILVILGRGDLV